MVKQLRSKNFFKEDIVKNKSEFNLNDELTAPIIDDTPIVESVKLKLKEEPKINDGLEDTIVYFTDVLNKSIRPKGWYNRFVYDGHISIMNKSLSALKDAKVNKETLSKKLNLKSVSKHEINLFKRKGLLDMKGWSNQYKLFSGKNKSMMVFMELRSGKFTHLLIILKFPYFDYADGRYLIDDNYKYYDVSTNLWCCDYHQDCCLPIKRKFDLNTINKAVGESHILEAETSVNPQSFKTFMESDIIQKVIKGAEMDQWLAFIKIMLIVILIAIAILLFMNGKVLYGK